MALEFLPMGQKDAERIAEWEYEEPYSFYNAKSDEEDLELLLNPKARKDVYYSVYDQGELIGFYTFERNDPYVEIGLGLKPERTGNGFGKQFLQAGLQYAKSQFHQDAFALSVAAFNKRAIKVYEKAGFKQVKTFMQKTNGSEYEFVRMTYEDSFSYYSNN
ncbi:GNAT family N-acetyltransferase [Salirhabdus sp. Marseille-P4669]|uniref:GNAT family N-acetyltransferase n=1 Tax=Salirhabdus sp. Marseille-P4669 TaxID=2042310 RepID=UPI000C7D5646|nr:GNAT family protein [Salirhabdus sp. Marseille-P4669]